MKDYRIITGKDLEELRRKVKEILPIDYVPVGDIGHYVDEHTSKRIFFQAMYKEK